MMTSIMTPYRGETNSRKVVSYLQLTLTFLLDINSKSSQTRSFPFPSRFNFWTASVMTHKQSSINLIKRQSNQNNSNTSKTLSKSRPALLSAFICKESRRCTSLSLVRTPPICDWYLKCIGHVILRKSTQSLIWGFSGNCHLYSTPAPEPLYWTDITTR